MIPPDISVTTLYLNNGKINGWHDAVSIHPLKVVYKPSRTPLDTSCSERFLRCLTIVTCLRLQGVDLRKADGIPKFTSIGGKVRALELVECVANINHLVDYLRHFPSLKQLSIFLPFLDLGEPLRDLDRTLEVPKLNGLLHLNIRGGMTEIDLLLGGLSCFPLGFSRVSLGYGCETSRLPTFLASLPTLTEIVLDGSWGLVNLTALKNLRVLELKRYGIGYIPILRTINSPHFAALLLTFRAEDLKHSAIGKGEDDHWTALDIELRAFHRRIGRGRPLNFYVASTRNDFRFSKGLAKALLRRFTNGKKVKIDEMLSIEGRADLRRISYSIS